MELLACPEKRFFWFWDETENAKTVFLARALKLTNVHRVDTPPALNREKCKLKTKEIWKRKKLRKSEKENWGNLKNVEREENSTACENASCA